MKTVLIGFEINVGTFKNDQGKDVPYSNRVITFITNTGEDRKRKGFFPYEEKFKLADLADILGVQPDDQLVNETFTALFTIDIRASFTS